MPSLEYIVRQLSEYEKKVVRFCADWPSDEIRYEEFPPDADHGILSYLWIATRFQRWGFVEKFAPRVMRVLPAMQDLVEELDKAPDYRGRMIQWYWSHWWSVPAWIFFTVSGWVVVGLMTILK